MRTREMMHPLCCIAVECPGTPDPDPVNAGGVETRVAGVLYKWTNYGRGWRTRWFSLAGGVLSYSKIHRLNDLPSDARLGVRIIGDASARLSRAPPVKSHGKPPGVVSLKISSFRESKSDDRKFYVFSPTKTLHLRTEAREDRAAWIEALVSARSVFTQRMLSQKEPFIQNDVSFSTEKLRERMQVEGLREAFIKDCEQIMLSEFLDSQRQMKLRYEEHLSFLGTFQHLEGDNGDDETAEIHDRQLQLMKHELSSSGHGKYSEYSTTESSDDVEKPEFDDLSEEDEPSFFDTKDSFSDSSSVYASPVRIIDNVDQGCGVENFSKDLEMMDVKTTLPNFQSIPHLERRKKLPEPLEKERSVSLWSIIKDNVGKDLTRVCLPVYFNEPLSSLQKCFEELEYSYLLDRAYEYGRMGNSLMRALNVAAFAVSAYASSEGRPCKPFNPLLGETYEADYPERGIRFFSEKVSHHPMLIACHCEGKGWKFWGDSTLRSKFWGRSIQLDPVGTLTLEFDDGEIFQWSKVTTTIYNLILGKVYCDHHGVMNIQGNRQYSCKLKFKEQSLLDRNPRLVQGFVEDVMGAKVATLSGKWDDSMYYTSGDAFLQAKDCNLTPKASLLWRRSTPPPNPTRYNLTSFAITLNELTSELKEKLPPTDSRLRPDQRHLENGEYDKANAEKIRLEKRQRMSRKLQENGWEPRWFRKGSEDGTYRYVGGYWESRSRKKWDGCPNIFGDFLEEVNNASNSKDQ